VREGGQRTAERDPRKAAILAEWLRRTLESYPPPAGRFLAEEKDRFRNPVGYTLREGLSLLLDELLGPMRQEGLREALEGIVRVRAVQDFTPREALAFLPLLKQILREQRWQAETPAELDARIDEALLLACDLYVRCREQIAEIKIGELRRRHYLAERAGWR